MMSFKKMISENRVTAFIVSLALFMDALDTTIINTAIPTMAKSLGVQPIDLKIALISYLISIAIFIPISGWIGDKYGIKRVFVTALGIFTISSIWCGFSSSLVELTIARSCQGLGGALMLPLGRLIILHTFKRHEVVNAMNAVVMIVSLGLMLGPLAGGFLTDHLSWHWIFWVNIPIGLFSIVIALRYLKNIPPRKVKPFNYIGFILFGGSLAILTFSLSYLSESTTDKYLGFAMIGTALIMLISCFLYSRNQSNPIINVTLFRIRTFKASILGNMLARVGFGGIPFLLPLLLQISLGYSAQLSGLLLAPIALGILTIKLASLRFLRIFGYKRLLLINTLLMGISVWTFQLIDATSSVYLIALLTFTFGLLIALQYSALNSLAYADITTEDLSSATSLVSTVQQLAQSFGVASGALLLTYFSPVLSKNFQLTISVFHQSFFAMGLFTIFSGVIFIKLKKNDGHQMLTIPSQEKISASNQT